MPRPASPHPTRGQLEVLNVLWEKGPSTARSVWEVLNAQRSRHYTSVNSQLNIMVGEGLLTCDRTRRAFVYEANVPHDKTASKIVNDVVNRLFKGSTSALVVQALEECNPSADEIDEITKAIRQYRRQRGKR